MPATTRVMVVMMPPAPRRARLGVLERALHILDPLPVTPHDIAYVPYAVKLDLELVHLGDDGVEPADLRVGVVDEVAGLVVDGHGDDLRLLRQVVDLGRDLAHQPVKVPAQLRERARVEQQQALRRGAARGA